MFKGFFGSYGKVKIQQGIAGLNDAIVSFDPEGATEAAILDMESNFDAINKEYSKAKQEWAREQKEADVIIATRDQRMLAAEHISGQLEADPDNAQLNEALDQLLNSLESMTDDIEREVEEAQDAKEVMDELDATVKMYATKLKSARSDIKKAGNAMKKAKRKQERAEDQAARATQAAGISSSVSGLSSALESMNRQAADAQASADAATRKSELLGTSSVDENDAVAAALAAVSDNAPASSSPRDRLAALRNK